MVVCLCRDYLNKIALSNFWRRHKRIKALVDVQENRGILIVRPAGSNGSPGSQFFLEPIKLTVANVSVLLTLSPMFEIAKAIINNIANNLCFSSAILQLFVKVRQ
jgi:uncharacterized Fe-S cluster-containing radical SAM superfamily protein